MDVERRDAGDDHVDNTREEQQLDQFESTSDFGIIPKMLRKLDELEAHLE